MSDFCEKSCADVLPSGGWSSARARRLALFRSGTAPAFWSGVMEIETLKQARLVRQVPTRLVDVSLSGCLVETDRELGVGTTGVLLIDLWGVPCRYPIRVLRETEQLGSGHTLQIAGEFTWKDRPASTMIADAIKQPERPLARILVGPWGQPAAH